jgi:hemerythrin
MINRSTSSAQEPIVWQVTGNRHKVWYTCPNERKGGAAMLISWDASISVGVKQIDDEHKQLIQIANSLHDAMKAGRGRDVEGDILNRLLNYTKTHFDAEDQLMKRDAYPEYERHKKEHNSLMLDVYAAIKDYQDGHGPLPANIMQFIKDWLLTHIKDTDKRLCVFLNGKGIR